jgi:hypothetical protein
MTKPELLNWSAAVVLVSLSTVPCKGGPQREITREASSVRPFELRLDKGRLTAKVRNARLLAVSERITEITAVNVIVDERLEDAELSKDVNSLPLDQALQRLLSDYDTFLFYGGVEQDSASVALRRIWVYPKGSASSLKPFSPDVWASGTELEVASRNTDPEVRASAYAALMTRPDQRSRNLLIDALRGATERDAELRERLLSNALSRSFPIPDHVLIDLARADPSDQIRLIALDALSQHPSAAQMAEAAKADPSEAVRFRAEEILKETTSRRKERTPSEREEQALNPN